MRNNIPVGSEKERAKIRAEQVRYVYSKFIPALLGSTLAAIMLAVLQWEVVNHKVFIAWLVVFSVVFIARTLIVFKFKQRERNDEECIRWGKIFYYNSIFVGFLWGVAVYISFPVNDMLHQLTLTLIVIGLCAGASSTLSPVKDSLLVFMLPMICVLIVLFLLEGGYEATSIAVVLILLIIFIIRGADMSYQSNRQNIVLRIRATEREEDLLKLKEEAVKSNQEKSRFLANMSHEIRTPLHGMLSYAEFGISKTGRVDDEKLIKYFSRILKSGERLKHLLDDLLDLSKLEAGKLDLSKAWGNINEVVDSCVSDQYAFLKSHHQQIETTYESGLPMIYCDAVRVRQIIMNLLNNAIKFSPDNGQIEINVSLSDDKEKDDAICIAIKDQGPGLIVEEVELIFKNFFQSSHSESALKGTGLGLAITRELVSAHKGKVWCENRDTQGAIFYVQLPIKPSFDEANC